MNEHKLPPRRTPSRAGEGVKQNAVTSGSRAVESAGGWGVDRYNSAGRLCLFTFALQPPVGPVLSTPFLFFPPRALVFRSATLSAPACLCSVPTLTPGECLRTRREALLLLTRQHCRATGARARRAAAQCANRRRHRRRRTAERRTSVRASESQATEPRRRATGPRLQPAAQRSAQSQGEAKRTAEAWERRQRRRRRR